MMVYYIEFTFFPLIISIFTIKFYITTTNNTNETKLFCVIKGGIYFVHLFIFS